MQKDRLTEFDLELREMFHDAEEVVPSRMWETLNGELDRRARRKVVALRWRRAAACAAAAAALSGIFITLNHTHRDTMTPVSDIVAEVPSAPAASENVPAAAMNDIADIEEQIASSSSLLMADIHEPAVHASGNTIPSAVTPVEEIIRHETVTEENHGIQADKVAETPATVKEAAEPWTDPFAMLEDEGKDDRHGTAIFLSGNVMSNDISGASNRPSRAPSTGLKQKTGISERSVSTYGIPLTFGIGANIPLASRLSIGTGVNWSLLSRSFTGIYTEVDKGGNVVRSINSEINNDLHYIGIPLNLYYNILTNRNLKFYAWGGGSAEKGIVNKFRIHNEPSDIFYTEKVKGIQWSAAAGVGLEFTINDFLGLYLDPSARYYFDCGQPTSVRTQKPYMLNFEVGLRFNLQ